MEDPNILYGGDIGGDSDSFQSVGDILLKDLTIGGNRIAFINALTEEQCSYDGMKQQSIIMARTLFGAGLRKDHVIALITENRHEFPYITFGAFILNSVVAPINVSYSKREIEHSLKLSQPKFVFVSAHAASATIEICRNLRFVQKVVLLDGQPPKGDKLVITLSELIAAHATTRFNVEDHSTQKIDTVDQTAMILCSSGTTGMPKGVLITQANLISCLQSFKELVGLMKNNIGPLISLHFAPWFHVLGFMNMFFCACLHDALFVFLPKFDEKIFLKSIEKYKATVTSVVPPIMVLLAKSPLVDNYDLSSLRIVSCGAAALSSETEDLVRKRLGENVMLRQGYGMSEGTFSLIAAGLDGKPGSVGVVVPDVYVKVIDENGKTLGANQRGELCFKGRRIMKGYINDPKATSETIDSDGWLHSGDVGFYDEDKQFFVVDRLKELIKYNGFQVPPAELEGLLLTHPKVKDVGVIGIPDEEVGERAMAFIVAQPGVQLEAKEVIDFVAKNVSHAKRLHGGVKFIEEIPKSPSGKILRRELRALHKSTQSKL